jgi:hypothetical protein
MPRWDQYFLEGLARGAQLGERAVDRERDDEFRNRSLEDGKAAREEDRKAREAERAADRADAERRLQAEKDYRDRELALRLRQLDEAKARAEREDAKTVELERQRSYWAAFDRHLKAGTEMSPEDVAGEIEDLQRQGDKIGDEDRVRLDALRRAYSVQRAALRSIRGKRVSIDPENPLTRTEEPTLGQGFELPETSGATRQSVSEAMREGMGRLRRPGQQQPQPAPAPATRSPLDIIPGVDPDGVSSRINALIQEKQAELDEHNREIAGGDDRHGFLNIWSRRASAADADARVRKAREDKAALDTVRGDPTHPRAREVLERLNRDY